MPVAARNPARRPVGIQKSCNVFLTPLGARVLIPGLAQRSWGQDARGLVFLGSFVSALATGLVFWGDPVGWGFLGFAVSAHLASTFDVLRQRSFPVFPRCLAAVATAGGMGLAVYCPLMAALAIYAFPAQADGPSRIGYLVNRLAYRQADPLPGHIVCFRPSPDAPPRAGRVLAVAGQEVRWDARRWRVDGKEIPDPDAGSLLSYPDRWEFHVPEHHLLIGLEPDAARSGAHGPLLLVSREQVVGRVWARCSPFWDRSIL
jgi:hypothetical protein